MKRAIRRATRLIRGPFDRRAAFRILHEYHARPRTLEEAVAGAIDLGTRGIYRVKSVQKKSEITALARAVARLEPKVVLEIGTLRGGTLFLWAQFASKQVVSCDLRDLSFKVPLFRAFPPPGSTVEVMVLRGDSHRPFFRRKVEEAIGGSPVDFLFIDGDHTEAGVEADYRDYRNLVRPGGLIAFHDIAENQPVPTNQVQHFWRRLKREARTEDFIDDPDQCGYGIGLVRV